MNKVLFAKLAVILLVMIVLAVPSSAWAVVHSVQVITSTGPVHGLYVAIHVDVDGIGWQTYELGCDVNGWVDTPDVDPAAPEDGWWWYDVYDGPGGYDGPDNSIDEVFYPEDEAILDQIP